jgi:hypothetical protein
VNHAAPPIKRIWQALRPAAPPTTAMQPRLAKTADHRKGDEAYFGTNPGSYTSAAVTGVASL